MVWRLRLELRAPTLTRITRRDISDTVGSQPIHIGGIHICIHLAEGMTPSPAAPIGDGLHLWTRSGHLKNSGANPGATISHADQHRQISAARRQLFDDVPGTITPVSMWFPGVCAP